MALAWKYEDTRQIIENVNKLCMEEKESGLIMSLERVWDRTGDLTEMSRATAQRILNKKVQQPTPSMEYKI